METMMTSKTHEPEDVDEVLALFRRRATEPHTKRLLQRRLRCGVKRVLRDLDARDEDPPPPGGDPAA